MTTKNEWMNPAEFRSFRNDHLQTTGYGNLFDYALEYIASNYEDHIVEIEPWEENFVKEYDINSGDLPCEIKISKRWNYLDKSFDSINEEHDEMFRLGYQPYPASEIFLKKSFVDFLHKIMLEHIDSYPMAFYRIPKNAIFNSEYYYIDDFPEEFSVGEILKFTDATDLYPFKYESGYISKAA